jgi:ACS family allantoate permease-like MFS transporter
MEIKIDQESDVQNDEKVPPPIIIVDEEEKVILRKIDAQWVSSSALTHCMLTTPSTSLMPLMFVTYMLQYLDKITLGYTAVMGIQADTVCPAKYLYYPS